MAILMFLPLMFYHSGVTEPGGQFLVVTSCDAHRFCCTITKALFGMNNKLVLGSCLAVNAVLTSFNRGVPLEIVPLFVSL